MCSEAVSCWRFLKELPRGGFGGGAWEERKCLEEMFQAEQARKLPGGGLELSTLVQSQGANPSRSL